MQVQGRIVYVATVNINVKKIERVFAPDGRVIGEKVRAVEIFEAAEEGQTQMEAWKGAERPAQDFAAKLSAVVEVPNPIVVPES